MIFHSVVAAFFRFSTFILIYADHIQTDTVATDPPTVPSQLTCHIVTRLSYCPVSRDILTAQVIELEMLNICIGEYFVVIGLDPLGKKIYIYHCPVIWPP